MYVTCAAHAGRAPYYLSWHSQGARAQSNYGRVEVTVRIVASSFNAVRTTAC
jgi:hypothetical protein